jgi:hypothetical protein
MTMDEITTWEDLLNSGELDGYNGDYINPIDVEVAENIPCERCGGKCIAFGKNSDRTGSYRAFSECQNCKRVIEF